MLLTQDQIKLFKQAIKEQKIKVVVFDLETSPSQFWGWGTGEQYVDAKNLVKGTETKVITAQYMYAHEKKASYFAWIENEDNDYKMDDSKVVEDISNILSSADIVIGQNSKQFDLKVLQERAKVLRLAPIQIDFMIDTLTSSRGSFKSMSHRLDYRSKQYGLGGKHKMEMQDWIDIVEGKTSPQKKMVPYGLKDVEDTMKVFWHELPYYNLPKATINKILKLIVNPEDKVKQEDKVYVPFKEKRFFCKKCKAAKKPKYSLTIKDNKVQCNICQSSWIKYVD